MHEAPAWAKEMAAARPMPFDAPVMRTFLPLRSAFVGSIAGYVSWREVGVKFAPEDVV